jgi:hypothetical protein
MIAALIVYGSLGLSLAFLAAWARSPALRAWIERPKYRFLDAVSAYDRVTRSPAGDRELQGP